MPVRVYSVFVSTPLLQNASNASNGVRKSKRKEYAKNHLHK